MTRLGPLDILVIQNAIEEYSRKYPDRPTPSAEEALAWRLNSRGKGKKQQQASVTAERGRMRIFESLRTWWMLH
jgi:hypothetical protein